MEAKTLHLTLKKKWFDMILSGEKKEEYREIKQYWFDRLVKSDGPIVFKLFETITFKNGYSANAPEMVVKLKEICVDHGLHSWGAEPNEIYYVLKLGEILSTKNIKKT